VIAGLAVVADDLTGACDLAGNVREQGWSAVVRLGVPGSGEVADADCRVVALKSRMADPERAASDSALAATRLLQAGGGLLYQKYCSTFDSTARGNIGPIGDALARVPRPGELALTVGTPATPAVGRTQYLGHLFVGSELLSESPMRDHPLTPMRDSSLPRLLGAQATAPVALVTLDAVRAGVGAVRRELDRALDAAVAHVLVDATNEADLDVVAQAIIETDASADRPVVAAGAAGLATALARVSGPRHAGAPLPRVPEGARLIVAGSASAATRAQLAAFTGPRLEVDPLELAADTAALDRLAERLGALLASTHEPVLLAATNAPEHVARSGAALGADAAGVLLECALAHLTARTVDDHGVTRLIVAGGETSGAVVAGLGVTELAVGPQLEPGLAWATARPAHAADPVALLLKSGNFGGSTLFTDAWSTAP
jgi:uncharacterized protein YgbK (DUF1537 family)